ncbi:MAG: hypothetical protein NWP80_00800 [Candidatus Gracilibacteria bacterium]|nr:hypothetical protein [Candidatus Gracilibacteria bacterium]
MKKYIKIFSLIIISIFFIIPNITIAGDTRNPVKIQVNTKVPGAKCEEVTDKDGKKTGLYKCSVTPGMSGFQELFAGLLKFLTAMAVLIGVLYIVINGIMLSMGGMDSSAKENAKKNVTSAIIGLLFLLLGGYILKIIAPWVYY